MMTTKSRKITLPERWESKACTVGTLVQVEEIRNEYGTPYKIKIKLRPRPGKDNAVIDGFSQETWDVYNQFEEF